jgi:rhodanese-related sulfurtransferase
MNALLAHFQRHPFLVSLAIATAMAVIAFELRQRRLEFAGVQPQEAIRLMNQGAQVIDVRDLEAYKAGHVSGAKHLDPAQLDQAAETLKKYRDKAVVLVCESGQTATRAAQKLHAGGFSKAFTLRGGLAAWRSEGLPLQRE